MLIKEEKDSSAESDFLKIFKSYLNIFIHFSKYKKLTSNPNTLYLIENYEEYSKFLKEFSPSSILISKDKIPLTDEQLLQPYFLEILRISYFDKENRQYDKLSHGERHLHSSMLLLYDTISSSKKNNFLLILDELDISLHPMWQKIIIDELVKLSNSFKKNLHIILSSHSPFILSDIPKQNIIFLKDGKQVKGIEKKQTFGANIHTLLSDGFFMEDGLMGEFAKGKIEDVISYLNDDKNSKIKNNDEAQKLINIIGEPIIKNQLQKMLDSKRLVKIDKIDLIEKQIKILQDELKKVQK